MPCQYERELRSHEGNRLTNTYEIFDERFVVWTLLDTGLRVSELPHLSEENFQWQQRRFVIYGKYGICTR